MPKLHSLRTINHITDLNTEDFEDSVLKDSTSEFQQRIDTLNQSLLDLQHLNENVESNNSSILNLLPHPEIPEKTAVIDLES